MKLVFVVLLVISMGFISTLLQATMAQPATRPPGAPSICDKLCGVRCNEAKNNATCRKYCGICCEKCDSCVPSGFIGNRDECPCYRDMRNSKGQPKCP